MQVSSDLLVQVVYQLQYRRIGTCGSAMALPGCDMHQSQYAPERNLQAMTWELRNRPLEFQGVSGKSPETNAGSQEISFLALWAW